MRIQSINQLGCKDKSSSWHSIGFPDGSSLGSTQQYHGGEKPTVILIFLFLLFYLFVSSVSLSGDDVLCRLLLRPFPSVGSPCFFFSPRPCSQFGFVSFRLSCDYGCIRMCVCFLPIYSGHKVRWTYPPGSHRRKVTQDFSSTFLLPCVP